ncbi:MAG: hypothetical protein KC583_17890 [Myxococcales bacterium]|nr:hypothetical protein [Myxococcales bacterium]
MDTLVRLLSVVALVANTAVLVVAVVWAARIVAQLDATRRSVHELRAALARIPDQLRAAVSAIDARVDATLTASEARVRAALSDTEDAVERAVEAADSAQRQARRAARDLDWAVDHLLDGRSPPATPPP